jgi:hypothetical protein
LGGRLSAEQLMTRLEQRGIKIQHSGPSRFRMVTHYGINSKDITSTLAGMREVMESSQRR